ncbi:imidazole glycerol phosphate synthase subunit HisH, partial [Acinetobacter baumannii]
PQLKGIDPSARFYFANSFAADLGGETAATCAYGDSSWAAIVRQGSLFGVQFHPEKSGENGLRLLKNFLEIAGC